MTYTRPLRRMMRQSLSRFLSERSELRTFIGRLRNLSAVNKARGYPARRGSYWPRSTVSIRKKPARFGRILAPAPGDVRYPSRGRISYIFPYKSDRYGARRSTADSPNRTIQKCDQRAYKFAGEGLSARSAFRRGCENSLRDISGVLDEYPRNDPSSCENRTLASA